MKNLVLDPVDLPTPDTNGEPPPVPLPDEPDIPNDQGGQLDWLAEHTGLGGDQK